MCYKIQPSNMLFYIPPPEGDSFNSNIYIRDDYFRDCGNNAEIWSLFKHLFELEVVLCTICVLHTHWSPVIIVPISRKIHRKMFPANVPQASIIFPWQMVKMIPKTWKEKTFRTLCAMNKTHVSRIHQVTWDEAFRSPDDVPSDSGNVSSTANSKPSARYPVMKKLQTGSWSSHISWQHLKCKGNAWVHQTLV